MKEYFYNLDAVDPLFHAIIIAKLREIQSTAGMEEATMGDLTEADEVEILRKYSVTLFKEYRALRAVFLENMVISPKSVKMKFSAN